MALKQFTTDFKNIGKQQFIRPNFGYRYFFDIQEANIFSFKNSKRLRDILKLVDTKKMAKGELKQSETLVDIGNIERRFNNLINCEEVSEIGSDKNILQAGEIIIPKLQPQMGNFFLNLKHKRYIGSSELLEYKIVTDNNPYFIYYLFTTGKFLSTLSQLESGKTHRRVNPTDLLEIRIPCIPKFIQDQIVAEIEPIENRIKELKNTIKEPEKIIDEVFAREFDFDLEKFERDKEKKVFFDRF
ncbi:MAG: restriction endonuclease subunit S [Candidatus Moeniiplasma glomeromycotorum]|nr:restriction endonuclease subunit S [Candidatus Moeniiplasma glomeromycotorum]MCE8168425.1 restriction endonuclease subunit S [Candidatus Moeniiplasma glomeromycotorum]MCE8169947.1 restriction endonuclease subunit S [Candidatus Moeniiplasma glomeromycotorum]